MNLLDLLLAYLLLGLAMGAVCWRANRETTPLGPVSIGLSILLWPLWAPMLLVADRGHEPTDSASSIELRIACGLERAREAAATAGLRQLLGAEACGRIRSEVRRASARLSAIEEALRSAGMGREAAEARVQELLADGASERASATARLHLQNILELERLRERDLRAMEELSELITAVHSQLVMARYAGSSAEGIGAIVGDMWTRVEGLGEALEITDPASTPEREREMA